MGDATVERIEAGDELSESVDIVEDNLESMRGLFPEAFSEDGIDFDVLRQLLGDEVAEGNEKYGLNWHGKRQARRIALAPSMGTLRPCPEESVDWDTTQNLMIEGDNLEVLKLLQKSYSGKVKLIYIDPPYNTGKDFIYKDDFRDNIKNYLELTGQTDEEGRKLSTNVESSGRFHTDWLNMMYPRLKLARNLLRDDGVIAVSIDDTEMQRLRELLDDVFDANNFFCQFVWNNEGNVDQQSKVKGVHEYIVTYARDREAVADPTVIDPNIEEDSKLFNERIENSITKNGPKNPASEVTLPVGFPAAFDEGLIPEREDKWPHIRKAIEVSDRKLREPAVVYSGWSSLNLLRLFIANGCVPVLDSEGKESSFAVTESGALYLYKTRSEMQGHVLSVIRNVGTTKQNSSMLKTLGVTFPYPKPVLLIKYMVEVFTSPGDMILDFFAGSGTTGHAAMLLNQDQQNRSFALVQLPSVATDDEAETDIADLTRDRLSAAGVRIREEHPDWGGDVGFRVFKLDTSNIRAWSPDREEIEASLLDYREHLADDRSEDDILYEMLLKLGLDLCVPIEERDIGGVAVSSVGGGVLMTCLAESIPVDAIEALGTGIASWLDELEPAGDTTVIFRDSAFENDVAKTNIAAILEQAGVTSVRSI